MGKNAKQALQLVMVVLAFVTLGAWIATVGHPLVIWSLRAGAPLAAAYVAWVLFRAPRRPGKLPDHLAQVSPKYFERDGVCLAPVFETAHGAAVLCVYFQNRYAGHATVRFAMLPPRRSLWFGRHRLPQVSADFECPGGAFGVLRVRFAVPAKYQGRRLAFDVGADVAYPTGRGELLRYRDGRPLPSTRELEGSDAAAVALLGGLGVLAAAAASSRGRARLVLPAGVDEAVADSVAPAYEVLSLPDLPTGGFPVLKAA